MSNETRSTGQPETQVGPFLAKIVSHLDPYYMGTLEVEILRYSGNQNSREGQLATVRYLSPFSGSTSIGFNGEGESYNDTQKSYGFWAVPPDIGTIVMVIFIDGDRSKGYWLGCVQDENMNFMIPGYAATSYAIDGSEERVPVAEYNKKGTDVSARDTTQLPKPAHPFQDVLTEQGLLLDDARGITTSSARREIPSAVFGISTPGPVDKQGPRGKVGKFEHLIDAAYISRLGGSSFVMDDGDDKFLRRQSPSEGPPDYAGVEQNETDGDVTRPHNELIRLRTRTGHQIVLHNSEDLIYIGNARGTTWIEMTSDGKIDIYAEDSVSLHTKQDLNFFADRDINFEAGRNFNIKVAEEMHTHVIGDQILIVDANQKIHVKQQVDHTYDTEFLHHVQGNVNIKFDSNYLHTIADNLDINVGSGTKLSSGSALDINSGSNNNFTAGGSTNIKSGGQHVETASQIHMNGPGAATAASASDAATAELPQVLKTHSLPDEEGNELVQSIMRRVPTHEPYAHHENLDPQKFKPDQTDRDVDGRNEDNSESIAEPAEYWKKYSTSLDTFKKEARE